MKSKMLLFIIFLGIGSVSYEAFASEITIKENEDKNPYALVHYFKTEEEAKSYIAHLNPNNPKIKYLNPTTVYHHKLRQDPQGPGFLLEIVGQGKTHYVTAVVTKTMPVDNVARLKNDNFYLAEKKINENKSKYRIVKIEEFIWEGNPNAHYKFVPKTHYTFDFTERNMPPLNLHKSLLKKGSTLAALIIALGVILYNSDKISIQLSEITNLLFSKLSLQR